MDKQYQHTPQEAAKQIRQTGGEEVFRKSSIVTRAAWGKSLDVDPDDLPQLDEQFGLTNEDDTPV